MRRESRARSTARLLLAALIGATGVEPIHSAPEARVPAAWITGTTSGEAVEARPFPRPLIPELGFPAPSWEELVGEPFWVTRPEPDGRNSAFALLEPLLARRAGTDARDVFRGASLPFRQEFVNVGASGLCSMVTRMSTGGSISENAWTVEWTSDLSYGDGHPPWARPSEHADFQLHRIQVSRRFDAGSSFRVGYKLAPGICALGVLDGVQGEVAVGAHLRFGAVAGLRPDRRTSDPSVDEPLGAAYFSAELGERGSLHYTGTLGMMGSIYQGKPDRLAYVLDQRIDVASKLRLNLSSEVDLYIDDAEVDDTLGLTRTVLATEAPLARAFTLRAGLDHQKRPDTRAERSLLPGSDLPFDDAARRYWIGGSCRLPGKVQLDGEVSYVGSPGAELDPWWRASISRAGLPGLPHLQMAARVHNLDASGAGYGGALTAQLPLLDRRLSLSPTLGFRFLEPAKGADLRVTDVSVRATVDAGPAQQVHAGVFYSFADDLERTMIDVAVQLRW